MSAAKILKAVPPVVWVAGAGALVVYLLGRSVLDKLGNASSGGVAGIGEALGAGAVELTTGVVKGAGSAAAGVAAGAGRAVFDPIVTHASGGKALSLGDWLYQVFNPKAHAYDPNAPAAADQGGSDKPHQRGPSSRYSAGAKRSPVLPQYKPTAWLGQ